MKAENSQTRTLFDEYKLHMNQSFNAIHRCDLETGRHEYEKMREIVERSEFPEDHGLLYIVKYKLESALEKGEEALQWLDKAKEYFDQTGNPRRLMLVHFEKAGNYFARNLYDQALICFNRALDCAVQMNDIDNQASIMNNMGECYLFMNRNSLALDYTQKSLEIRRKLNQTEKVGLSLTNITRIYNNLGEYERGLEYGLQALEIFKASGQITYYANALNIVGITCHCMKQYEQALEYLHQSLEIKRDQKDSIRISNTLNGIGNVYYQLADYPNARKYHTQALQLRKDRGADVLMSRSQIRLAYVAFMTEQYDEAEALCLEACKHLDDDNQIRVELYDLFAKIYNVKKDFEKAFAYKEKHLKKYIEIAKEDNQQMLAEMRTKFELEQREREAELFKEKNHELEEKNRLILQQKEDLDKTLKELRRSERNLDFLADEIKSSFQTRIVGNSTTVRNIIQLMSKVARADATSVLIMGESGTGKELVARGIHEMSQRKQKYFHAINSSAISSTLFESEFFGYEKGAFTGALSQKAGWFEVANGGTLFLDEIGNMPLDHQIKLLRVLEERNIVRVGARHEIPVNVRVISATNMDLLELVSQKQFREDLYHRLAAFVIQIPPLRERKEDIQPLIEHFVNTYAPRLNKSVRRIDPQIFTTIESYDFPGNIRELRNMVERALIICDSPTLQLQHFSIPINNMELPCTDDENIIPLETIEKTMLLRALKRTSGNQTKAAKLLGVSQKAVERRINKFNLREEF